MVANGVKAAWLKSSRVGFFLRVCAGRRDAFFSNWSACRSALGALVATYVSRQKAGRRVVLSGVSERVLRMLKITNVESLFLTFPTLEDAIDGLTRAGVA